MESISICVSDIPKSKFKKLENGKVYLKLIVSKRKEIDKYGNDLAVSVSKTKEEREAKAETIYCGSGKAFVQNSTPTAEQIENSPEANVEDLPF
jgi:hypothetical protein